MRPSDLTRIVLFAITFFSSATATVKDIDNHLSQRHDHHHEDSDLPDTSKSHLSSPVNHAHDQGTPSASLALVAPSSPPKVMNTAHSHAHGHDHGSHSPAKTTLDDAEIHRWHHYPISYLAADFRLTNDTAIFGEEFDQDWDPESVSSHKGLALTHAGLELLAYFGVLPIALALRAANHSFHYLVNGVFLATAIVGWILGTAYAGGTPDRYEHAIHSTLGTSLIALSILLALIDSLHLIQKGLMYYRESTGNTFQTFSWTGLLSAISGKEAREEGDAHEMLGLTLSEPEHEDESFSENARMVPSVGDEYEDVEFQRRSSGPHQSRDTRRPFTLPERGLSSSSRNSTGSEGTLHNHERPLMEDLESKPQSTLRGAFDVNQRSESSDGRRMKGLLAWEEKSPKLTFCRFGAFVLSCLRRLQVVFAYVLILTAFSTYTGMCRASFLPGCAAHFIKGSIFFGYGVLTFSRYLGAYAELGWAWNKRPDGRSGPTAEMVECAVIFFYGITNTWMERFGAQAGDPYTVKQVQHISIAVMFWFAGLSGMLLESRTMRRVLATIGAKRRNVEEPPSYSFSFNPLPALVIAVTGLAMAAHHQDYVFQVSIHSLWGNLLAMGSTFRLLTYFFLYLRPPTSTLPSRPPTEILASFGYAAGGIVFILSVEEISFAAMRAGYDDMMAFLNVTIALTSLIFCWIMIVLGVKGWAVGRVARQRNQGSV